MSHPTFRRVPERRWRLGALACVMAATSVLVERAPAASQAGVEAVSAASPGNRDLVIARRNLMAAVGRNMDGITGMIEPGGTLEAADATEHADEIAVLLLAFPYLFPAGSDNWTEARERDDPAGVTEAAPAVWQQAPAFLAMARAASQLATDASRPADAADFRARAASLANTCVACHERFRREERPYVVPVPPLDPSLRR